MPPKKRYNWIAILMGSAIALSLRLILWQLDAHFGVVPMIDISVICVFAFFIAIGAMISGHFAKAWSKPVAPYRVVPVAAIFAALLCAWLSSPAILKFFKPLLSNIFSMREQGTWMAFLVAPTLAKVFAAPCAFFFGLALPWALHANRPAKAMASALSAAAITFLLLALTPTFIVIALVILVLIMASIRAGSEDANVNRSDVPAWPAMMFVVFGGAVMAIFLAPAIRISRIALPEGGFSGTILVLSLATVAAVGCAIGEKFSARRNPLAIAGVAFLITGIAAILLSPFFRMLPAIIQSANQTAASIPPFSHLTEFVILVVFFLIPIGGMALGSSVAMNVFVLRSRLTRSSSGTLVVSAWLVAFALALLITAALGIARITIPDLFLASSVMASIAGIAVMIFSARHAKSSFASVMIGAVLLVGALILVVEIRSPWTPSELIAQDARVVHYREAIDGSLIMTQDESRQITAWVDGSPVVEPDSTLSASSNMAGVLSMLLSPGASRVAIEGVGNGELLESVTAFPHVAYTFVFEPRATMLNAAVYFRETSNQAFARPGVKILRLDILSRLQTGNDRYDVIILRPKNIISIEQLRLFRGHLSDRGMLALPLQGKELSLANFQQIAAGFLEVFPHVVVMEIAPNEYLIAGAKSEVELNVSRYLQSLALKPVVQSLSAIDAMKNPEVVPSSFICRGDSLKPLISMKPVRNIETLRPAYSTESQSEAILAFLLSAQTNPFATFLSTDNVPEDQVKILREAIGRQLQARGLRLEFQQRVDKGRMTEALRAGQAMLRLSGSDPRVQQVFREGLQELAQRRRMLGDAQGAKSLEQSLKLIAPATRPTEKKETLPSLQNFLEQGRAALKARNYADAEKNFRAALNVNRDDVEARYELARLVLAKDQWPEALELLEPLRSREDLSAEGRITIASALALADRNDEAIKELEKALEGGFKDRALLERTPFLKNLRKEKAYQELVAKYFAEMPATAPR